MQASLVDSDAIVAEVMQRWPASVPVFVEFRMACPGCVFSPFVTVREAARAYGVQLDELLACLEDTIRPEAMPANNEDRAEAPAGKER